jgi:hypothetical protein
MIWGSHQINKSPKHSRENKKPHALTYHVSRYFEDPILTFTVGDDDTQRFHIHRGLVASSSVVFEDMFRGFEPDHSPDILLHDVSPKAFAIFAYWLYKESFPELEEDASALTLCLQAFLFADAYSILPFKQLSHDKIKERLTNAGLPPKKIVRELFSYGDVTKSLQEILVESVTKQIHERTVPHDAVEWLNSSRSEIPKFSMDVAESLTRRILKSACRSTRLQSTHSPRSFVLAYLGSQLEKMPFSFALSTERRLHPRCLHLR